MLSDAREEGVILFGLFRISPDSTRVAYAARLDPNDPYTLYSVPIDRGEEPLRLSDFAQPGLGRLEISPDSTSVVLIAVVEEGGTIFELFSTPIDEEGGLVKLNPPLCRRRYKRGILAGTKGDIWS